MKILSDYHHGGAARAQVLLLGYRLGHQVYFPSVTLVEELGLDNSIILPCVPSWLTSLGGVPRSMLDKNGAYPYIIHSLEEMREVDWDAFLITRAETQELFKRLKRELFSTRDIKMIALTGNDAHLT